MDVDMFLDEEIPKYKAKDPKGCLGINSASARHILQGRNVCTKKLAKKHL